MNYSRIYKSIISNATNLNRSKKKDIYYESHHIVPKCLGGTNANENLVLLTPKEHYICHRLLTKMYPGNYKLVRAFWLMCNAKNQYQQTRYIVSARTYQEARLMYTNILVSDNTRLKMSRARVGFTQTEDTKKKISIANSKPKNKVSCIYCNKIVSVGANSTRWHFDNCKEKPGNELLVRKSLTSGKTITCIHCNVTGGINVMKRWHFDNCKEKH